MFPEKKYLRGSPKGKQFHQSGNAAVYKNTAPDIPAVNCYDAQDVATKY
jgi:hypothetical protein